MLRAAIVGLGHWGRNLVDSVNGSAAIHLVAAMTQRPARSADFAAAHALRTATSYSELLTGPGIGGLVLATPHTAKKRTPNSSLMADVDCHQLTMEGENTGVVELSVEWIRDDAVYFDMNRYAKQHAAADA